MLSIADLVNFINNIFCNNKVLPAAPIHFSGQAGLDVGKIWGVKSDVYVYMDEEITFTENKSSRSRRTNSYID